MGTRAVLLANARRKGFAVPEGFVVLRKTFGDFVRDTQLKLLLPQLEKRIIGRSAPMEALGRELGALIKGTPVPAHIMLDVESGCKQLGLGNRALGRAVTLRACPVDGRLSSAGLERAVAVTRLSEVEGRVKQCWASAFDAVNLEALRHFGLSFEEAAPAVLVAETVPCEVSGLLFTHAPGEPGSVLIEAVWGFHEALTEGKFEASRYMVRRAEPASVAASEAQQPWEYALGPQSAMVRREVPAERVARAKLSRVEIEELLRAGLELERLVGGAVGVEWAIHAGVVFVLQVVPLAVGPAPPSEAESAERYIRAVAVAEGAARGRSAQDLARPVAAKPPASAQRVARAEPATAEPATAEPATAEPAIAEPASALLSLAPAPAAAFPEPPPAAPPPTASALRAAPAPPTSRRPERAAPVDAPSPGARSTAMLPVITSTLLVELPPGARAQDAAAIPHAGLVIDLTKWAQAARDPAELAPALAAAAAAAFPRPVLVALSDLDPEAYEAMHETTLNVPALDAAFLERILAPTMGELRTVARAARQVGATNLHLIAPLIKSAHDSRVLRAALEAAGLAGGGAPHTLIFSELRSPSTLLYNVDFASEHDGIVFRANRFYKELMREGASSWSPPEPSGTASPAQGDHPAQGFVHALLTVTRAFEGGGGTVLVLLEDEGDLGTLWFYREIGVDGYIVKLEDARACTMALAELEKRPQAGGRKRGVPR